MSPQRGGREPQALVWCHHGGGGDGAAGIAEMAALGVVPQSVTGNNRDSALGNSNIQEEEEQGVA